MARSIARSLSREPGEETVAEELKASLEGGAVRRSVEFWPDEGEDHVGELVVQLGRLLGGEADRAQCGREGRSQCEGVRAGQRPPEQRHRPRVLEQDRTRRAGQAGSKDTRGSSTTST
jgi:hypothetical protein